LFLPYEASSIYAYGRTFLFDYTTITEASLHMISQKVQALWQKRENQL